MHRRSFITTLAATGLTAGAARAEGRDILQQGDPRPVRLQIGGGFVTVQRLVVADSRRAFGIDWTGGAPVFDENRVDLSGLGGLFRKPFRTRWVEAQPLGEVTLNGETLVARVADSGPYLGAQTTLGAGNLSWDLPGRLAALSIVPQGGRPAGALRMGDDGRLLIALPQAQPAF